MNSKSENICLIIDNRLLYHGQERREEHEVKRVPNYYYFRKMFSLEILNWFHNFELFIITPGVIFFLFYLFFETTKAKNEFAVLESWRKNSISCFVDVDTWIILKPRKSCDKFEPDDNCKCNLSLLLHPQTKC